MRFRNKSVDARVLRPAGVFVEAGGEFDATPEQVPGLVLQCGPDGAWEPVDDDAKAAVTAAEALQHEHDAATSLGNALKALGSEVGGELGSALTKADDDEKPKRASRQAKVEE